MVATLVYVNIYEGSEGEAVFEFVDRGWWVLPNLDKEFKKGDKKLNKTLKLCLKQKWYTPELLHDYKPLTFITNRGFLIREDD